MQIHEARILDVLVQASRTPCETVAQEQEERVSSDISTSSGYHDAFFSSHQPQRRGYATLLASGWRALPALLLRI